jgi:hypothetical protein
MWRILDVKVESGLDHKFGPPECSPCMCRLRSVSVEPC